MKRPLILCLVALLAGGMARGADEPMVTVPFRVHLITGTEFDENGTRVDMWVTAADFSNSVLPEINRIWKPAGVQWKMESIVVEPAKQDTGLQEIVTRIASAEKLDMRSLLDFIPDHGRRLDHVNLYLLPRIGAENGVAGLGGKIAIASIWRKPNGGPIRRAPLVACQPPLVSVSKTCAHELGHTLGLTHPDPQLKNRLMIAGPGLLLIPEEIETARQRAAVLAKE